MTDKKTFGSFIKHKRLEKNYSQKDLASLLSVTEGAISKWERGASHPDITLITEICRVLDISEHEFFTANEDTKEPESSKRHFAWWEILIIVLSFPIWFSLLFSAIAVVFSVYISVWAVIVSLWAIFGSFVGSFFGGVVAGVMFIAQGNLSSGLAVIAAGLLLGGLSIFAFFGCKFSTKGILIFTKKALSWLKGRFLNKEGI